MFVLKKEEENLIFIIRPFGVGVGLRSQEEKWRRVYVKKRAMTTSQRPSRKRNSQKLKEMRPGSSVVMTQLDVHFRAQFT